MCIRLQPIVYFVMYELLYIRALRQIVIHFKEHLKYYQNSTFKNLSLAVYIFYCSYLIQNLSDGPTVIKNVPYSTSVTLPDQYKGLVPAQDTLRIAP